jgi:ribosomal protein S18 acetylase RimI-like enzyme
VSGTADRSERAFDRHRDLPTLLALVANGRASSHPHAFLHPGGLQWLLRRLGHGAFAVGQWTDATELAGAVVDDAGYVLLQTATGSLEDHLWLLDHAETRVRGRGATSIEISAWDSDAELVAALRSRGYEPSGTYGHELTFDCAGDPPAETLPDGFVMRHLDAKLDDAYVALHHAAWSTWAPSTYDRAMHDAVTAMPDFDRTLVPIVAAPDGTLAASCIGWFDPRTRTTEIEPLGTHPVFRRLGLARAIVREVVRRSALRGARTVMVWGVSANPAAVSLYESAGFRGRRILREYRRTL